MMPDLMPDTQANDRDQDAEGITRGGGGATGEGGGGGVAPTDIPPENSAQRVFLYGEVEVAAATGISVRQLQKSRQKNLRADVDWGLNGLRVAYSLSGLRLILEKLTGRPTQGDELEKLARQTLLPGMTAPDATTRAWVHKTFPNPFLLQVRLGDGSLQMLRVKETKNFRMGMEGPVRLNPPTQQFELARRLPRFPGRW